MTRAATPTGTSPRLPRELWPYLRVVTVAAMVALAVTCWAVPSTGLPILWGLVVPALPLLWVLVPGLWRNVCPMASVNQIPRRAKFTKARTLPPWLERHGYTIGASMFFIAVALRPSLLESNGPAAALMLIGALAIAFVGGTLFRGKSGMCGSVCPLRPTQSVYSRAPSATVAHAHCRPCVGCTTNCQDLMPTRSLLADLKSAGRGEPRWVFAGLLPGFIFGFGTIPTGSSFGHTAWFLAAWALFSLGLLTIADSYTRLGRGRLTALWGAAALILFYWTSAPTTAAAIESLGNVELGAGAVWEARAVVAVLVAIWLVRGLKLAAADARRDAEVGTDPAQPFGTPLPVLAPEPPRTPLHAIDGADRRGRPDEAGDAVASTRTQAQVIAAAVAADAPVHADGGLQVADDHGRAVVASATPIVAGEPPVQIPDRRGPHRSDRTPTIVFWPDGSAVPVPAHEPTIAAAARQVGISLPEGCGTGLCGCDPVYIMSGAEGLAPPGEQERSTIERLGLPSHARLACATRVIGDVVVSLEPTAQASDEIQPSAPLKVTPPAPAAQADRRATPPAPSDVQRVVIVGNGVAGITAASHMRRLHPDCSIDIVSRSPHPFYNRIAITRLIHRPQGLGSLQLMPDRWYEEQRITQWLNTSAARIDRDAKELVLGTGQALPYDRLVIASGARWAKPNLPGIQTQGTFGLREAADAIRIRAYAQSRNVRRAAVLGGGLLGLEVAEALAKLGVEVTVVERADALSAHVLDDEAARLLRGSMEAAGVKVRLGTSVKELRGGRKLEALVLDDGELVAAEMAIVCVGIQPLTEIAEDAGLEVARGIVVDGQMRTSDPSILACGDAAEFDGKVGGHWAIGAAQAEVAAVTAFGGTRNFRHTAVPTVLKLDDLSVLSVGDVRRRDGIDVVAARTNGEERYQVTFMDGARPVGLIAINGGGEVDAIVDSIVHGTPLPEHVDPRGELPGPRILREVS